MFTGEKLSSPSFEGGTDFTYISLPCTSYSCPVNFLEIEKCVLDYMRSRSIHELVYFHS